MGAQKQDYLLRQIDLLRQFVQRVLRKQPDPELDEALLLAFHLQEKLFPAPPAEFLRLELAEQIALLRRGESRQAGNDKCRLFAALLAETGELYRHKGQAEMASGARQMALFAALSVVDDDPADLDTLGLARELAATLEPQTLHPVVVELLERVGTPGNPPSA